MTKQRLDLSTKQSLAITPSLLQSINILHLSTNDLNLLISDELERNALLEETSIIIEPNTIKNDTDHDDPFMFISQNISSIEDILKQISLLNLTKEEEFIANYMLLALSENGYLETSITILSNHLHITEHKLLEVLYKLQTLEPTGIFARNLQESISLQLKYNNQYTIATKLILDNLELVAKNDLKTLSQITKLSQEEIILSIKHIKNTNPKPLNLSTNEVIHTRIADIIIYIENNELIVTLNDKTLRSIYFNEESYNLYKTSNTKDTNLDFIKTQYTSAKNLISAISQRQKTLLIIAKVIAEQQKHFFFKGLMYFNQISLQDIATICNMNQSTISRAIHSKYVLSPFGIHEMKFFFSSKISSKNDKNISSTKVKELIKNIIITETPDAILSDELIAKELIKFNIVIARRTVAKYREALGFPSSNIRQQHYKQKICT